MSPTHTSPPGGNPPPDDRGRTKVEQQSGEGTQRAPRLPHERDQSSDSQQMRDGRPSTKDRRALEDVERGVVDTDLGPPLERARRNMGGDKR